jgi:hypothetical protein
VIEPSRPQLSFAEGLIQEEVGPLWEEWMRQVDEVLCDRELVQIVYQALARRWPQSRTRGRPATPADVVLRMLLLKHMRNWSYRVLEREVRANLGRKPYLVTADAAFFSQRNEDAAHARGIKRVAVPNRSTKSAQRKKLEKKRWFRNAQRSRTGCEGRISLLKRRHGLSRCRYKGMPGIQRWVGPGVLADNLINIGYALAASSSNSPSP